MGVPLVEPEYVFGLRGGVTESVVHVDTDTVAYPAGSYLVLHDTAKQQQHFVSLTEEATPTALAISPKRLGLGTGVVELDVVVLFLYFFRILWVVFEYFGLQN